MKNKETIEVSKLIDAYIRGKLSRGEIDELWLLFLKKPYYYELFETELHLRNLIQNKRGSEGLITGKSDRKMSIKQWIMAAAATVIIVLTIQIYLNESIPDLGSLALSDIAYNEMAAGNVERSEDDREISIETDINRAMAVAYMSREEESLDMFRELKSSVVNESQNVRIEFNMAILHYNRSEYELARDTFISVAASQALDEIYIERAYWFLANTYLKMNDQEEAMETFLKIILLDGKNSETASTILGALRNRGD